MELQQALPELSSRLLAKLRQKATVMEIPKKTEILHEGQYVKVIPIVLEGLIKVHTRYEEKELLLYYIRPSESCAMSFSASLGNEPSKIYATTEQDTNIRQRPATPTVFELYRKHTNPEASAKNAWWVSNALGPYPALNYSSHPSYGPQYGANYIQPGSLISTDAYNSLGDPRTFTNAQHDLTGEMRQFFDDNFNNQFVEGSAGVSNLPEDKAAIEQFILQTYTDAASGAYNNPWGIGPLNNDQFNVLAAEKIIEEFQPELLVVNMQDVDVCHTNFTAYANNLVRADYALGHLWQTIQSTPGMADNTILIAVPEHGRNAEPNTVIDAYGRYAIDHTNDEMSREIFCLVAGPSGKVIQNQVIDQVMGQTIDVVPTVAKILGFYDDVAGMLPGQPLDAALA